MSSTDYVSDCCFCLLTKFFMLSLHFIMKRFWVFSHISQLMKIRNSRKRFTYPYALFAIFFKSSCLHLESISTNVSSWSLLPLSTYSNFLWTVCPFILMWFTTSSDDWDLFLSDALFSIVFSEFLRLNWFSVSCILFHNLSSLIPSPIFIL